MVHQFSKVLSLFQITRFYQSESTADFEEIMPIEMKVCARWTPFEYVKLAIFDFLIEFNQNIANLTGKLLDIRAPLCYNQITINFKDTMDCFS